MTANKASVISKRKLANVITTAIMLLHFIKKYFVILRLCLCLLKTHTALMSFFRDNNRSISNNGSITITSTFYLCCIYLSVVYLLKKEKRTLIMALLNDS